jgi:hypothetical protein
MTKAPNHEQIVELAKELYYRDMAKSGMENFNVPEINELSENGFLAQAQGELMRAEDSDYKCHIEEEARNLGLIRERKGLIINLNMSAKNRARTSDSRITIARLLIVGFFAFLMLKLYI